MATTNIQSFAGDVEVAGELTVTGQLNSTTGSDKVKLTATTASETDYIPLSRGTTGAQPLYTDSNLTYNPANNVIGANLSGNVTGNVSGNAAFATSATHANNANTVAFTDRDGSNNTDYIAFVDSHAAGDKALFTDQNLTYNSSTNTIGANLSGNVTGNVSGNVSGNAAFATNATYANSAGFATSATHANNANTVAFTDRDGSNNTDYIAFVDTHTVGDKALYTDQNLTYNSSTNHINANVPYANNAGQLDGSTKSTGANANSIAQRDGGPDLHTRLFRSTYTNQNTISGAMAFRVNNGNDNYIRFCSNTGSIRTFLNVPTRTGGNASGNWSINVNGSAANISSSNATMPAYIVHAGDTNTYFGFPSNDAFRIVTSGSERLRVEPGGDVGIGTNNPTSKLHVKGDVSVTNVSTTNNVQLVAVSGTAQWVREGQMRGIGIVNDTYFGNVNEFGGTSLSGDGQYACFGAIREDKYGGDAGAAYVFNRGASGAEGIWGQQQRLVGSGVQGADNYGWDTALNYNGNYAIVGNPLDDSPTHDVGSAYIFLRSGSTWSQQALLSPPATNSPSWFGVSVDMSGAGDWAVIGARFSDVPVYDTGSAFWYQRSGTTWTHRQTRSAPDAQTSDRFAAQVAMSNDASTTVIGSDHEDTRGGNAGAAYVYVRSGTNWNYQAKLMAPDGQASDHFGRGTIGVSPDGNAVAIGAPWEDQRSGDAGAVYMYTRSGTSWTYRQKIIAPHTGGHRFGASCDLSTGGNKLIVGAPYDDQHYFSNNGHVYLYNRSGNTWYLEAEAIEDGELLNTNDHFGDTVAISDAGDVVLVSAPGKDNSPFGNDGTGYIYRYNKDVNLAVSSQIRADGAVLSFTGQHMCTPVGFMGQGLIVSANNNRYVSLNGRLVTGIDAIKSSESLPVVSLSNVANDRSVFGVVDHIERGNATIRKQSRGVGMIIGEKEVGDNKVIVNSLGEGAIWVANTNGNLLSGDYMTTSNIAGFAQRQDDDTLHSYTVAKITMDCDFNPDLVPVQVILKDENDQNVLDSNGYIQWVDTEEKSPEYVMRYMTVDGRFTDEANAVHRVAYVGCTYHCG